MNGVGISNTKTNYLAPLQNHLSSIEALRKLEKTGKSLPKTDGSIVKNSGWMSRVSWRYQRHHEQIFPHRSHPPAPANRDIPLRS